MYPLLNSAPVILAMIIILPMIPAILIFKLLPNTAEVNGPFSGLTIKLGGAFGAYFVLLLLVVTTHDIWKPPVPYQLWTVTGTLTDNNGNPIEDIAPGDISLQPAAIQYSGDWFKMTNIPVDATAGGDIPTLLVWHAGFGSVPISLDPSAANPAGVQVDATKHIITLTNLRLPVLSQAYQAGPPLNAQATTPATPPQNRTAGGKP